uniref:Exonuclease domain-containing protein n=1 Tax=Glossina austeni TaxID=7395 RepID=A0A1A9VPD5_GLOAU
MGKLWLKNEVETLEEELRKNPLSVVMTTFLVVGAKALTECNGIAKILLKNKKFIVLIANAVDGYLNYRIIDVSSIKELAKRWNAQVYNAAPKKFVHRASDDVKESLEELQYYKTNQFKLN